MGRPTALLLALVLLVTACGDDGGDVSAGGGGGSAVTFDDLVGKAYESTGVTGHELVEGSTVTLTFIDGRISAIAGCNTQNADAGIEDGTLVVGELASTMMGCEDALMDQDQWLAGFLGDRPAVALADGDLTLTTDEVTLELTEQP